MKTSWDSALDSAQLRESLQKLLQANPPDEERLLAELESQRRRGYPVYSSVLYILTHLNFSETEARRHWQRIQAHRERMRKELSRDVGLRVALLDYFVNLSGELKNPKVIEISIYEKTERSAITDGLTGLYNHSYFIQALRREVLRSKRHDFVLSLVLFDLDDFKRVNDTHGHLAGDHLLVKASALIRESLREIDIAARYGGEEFAVVLPDTQRLGAFIVADRIRMKIERHFLRKRSKVGVTVSGGIATCPADATSGEDLVAAADKALYRAKTEGKNRIVLFQGERRRHLRVPAIHPVLVTVPTGHRAAALTQNLSDGGLLLRLKDPVPVGSMLNLELRPTGAPPVDLHGEVVRVDAVPDRAAALFNVGLRLLRDPPNLVALFNPQRIIEV